MPAKVDRRGVRYGRLVAIEEVGQNVHRHFLWRCKCDCGKEIVTNGACLGGKHTRSCGCLAREASAINGRLTGKGPPPTHGMSKRREYFVWKTMKRRATGRFAEKDRKVYEGVTLCDRWNDFANFFSDMGPRPSDKHSIDRINNDRGYEPSNCRWATAHEQRMNQRRMKEIA